MNKGRLKRKSKKRRQRIRKPNKVTPSSKKTIKNRFINFLKSIWGVFSTISIVAGLSGILVFKQCYHEATSTKQQLWEEERFIKGLLIPQYIQLSNPIVTIDYGSFYGGFTVGFNQIKNGVDFEQNLFLCPDSSNPVKIRFKLMNNRLYLSTIVKDIQNGEVVAIMNYNKWALFKDNLLTFSDSDTSLEVLDRDGNVILSLLLKENATIKLRGYFVGDNYITVFNGVGINECISKADDDYKQRALEEIKEIKSLKKYFF